jgi:hypothetical protein
MCTVQENVKAAIISSPETRDSGSSGGEKRKNKIFPKRKGWCCGSADHVEPESSGITYNYLRMNIILTLDSPYLKPIGYL